ncbi:BsuBI/PstI family type II restriction endonuclease [Opitutales bacterium ASA1]|uniref:BsuBI/PstI family type II restriction endonuclease n=1 Tax=Congregicoccus parvus TaxID=3081749 RepID=UPI002B2C8019|nr:BsuBI/PstI family type II restriction endonuclease [Opitutales bacterium ASA1]
MPADKPNRKAATRKKRLAETIDALTALQFGPRQRNETAAYTLLALLDLPPDTPWADAQAPLRGITPIIEFIATVYGNRYAPNTRETIRDDAVKFFVEEGLLLRNPDNPNRPTNSGKTVYQIEPTALALFRTFGTPDWATALRRYLASRETLKHEIARKRDLARVPVTLPDGSRVALSPGGQNPLIKAIIEIFCPTFAPGGVVLYVGDTENKFVHLQTAALAALGVTLDSAAKIPDVIVHHRAKNWLLLIEAVTSAGPVDGKRRKELKDLFVGCKAGLVFVTAFENRRTMQTFVSQIAWESEVWIAEDPDHLIHFNGERFLGPYPDVMPAKP